MIDVKGFIQALAIPRGRGGFNIARYQDRAAEAAMYASARTNDRATVRRELTNVRCIINLASMGSSAAQRSARASQSEAVTQTSITDLNAVNSKAAQME